MIKIGDIYSNQLAPRPAVYGIAVVTKITKKNIYYKYTMSSNVYIVNKEYKCMIDEFLNIFYKPTEKELDELTVRYMIE